MAQGGCDAESSEFCSADGGACRRGDAGSGAGAQEAPKSIKVGYAISLSGPQSAGAMLTTVPNYRLWVDEVNKAGGLMLKKYNKRIPIEVTEIDDRSNNEDMVRLVERLMTVDKVDIVLSPWGTGPNLQAAPTFAKNGYPQIIGTRQPTRSPSWCSASRRRSGSSACRATAPRRSSTCWPT